MVFKLQSGHDFVTETAAYNVQRCMTQKIHVYVQELWFSRSAHRLMLVNISMTFHEDILNGFQVTERTALYSILGIATATYKVQRDISKNIYPRVIVLASCTSSNGG